MAREWMWEAILWLSAVTNNRIQRRREPVSDPVKSESVEPVTCSAAMWSQTSRLRACER